MKLFFIIYVLFTQGNIYFFKNSCIVELKIHFIKKKKYIFVKIL